MTSTDVDKKINVIVASMRCRARLKHWISPLKILAEEVPFLRAKGTSLQNDPRALAGGLTKFCKSILYVLLPKNLFIKKFLCAFCKFSDKPCLLEKYWYNCFAKYMFYVFQLSISVVSGLMAADNILVTMRRLQTFNPNLVWVIQKICVFLGNVRKVLVGAVYSLGSVNLEQFFPE